MQMFGRTVIYTDATSVTAENVRDVLSKALPVHMQNQCEIDYLYKYYKGKTPILHKKKEVRPTINHQICENRANEIVNFKTGYVKDVFRRAIEVEAELGKCAQRYPFLSVKSQDQEEIQTSLGKRRSKKNQKQ
ncbi:MAG: phage portal protein [Clostridia bacterium]|nr:phage portal protein [Clostridia bacterium]